jgi:glycerol-3-phosphate responsive antiterminator
MFKEYFTANGLIAYLTDQYNTKNIKVNNAIDNYNEAKKRAFLAVHRVYLLSMHSLSNEPSTDCLIDNVEQVIGYVVEKLNVFLPSFLNHLRMDLNRQPLTIKVVICDFEYVFIRHFLLSEEAIHLFTAAKVSMSLIVYISRRYQH